LFSHIGQAVQVQEQTHQIFVASSQIVAGSVGRGEHQIRAERARVVGRKGKDEVVWRLCMTVWAEALEIRVAERPSSKKKSSMMTTRMSRCD